MSFWAVCCRPWGCAGAGVHHEKTGFRVEGVSNFALRPCSRADRKHRKRDEKQHRKQPHKARKSARKNNHKQQLKFENDHFGSQNGTQNRPRSLSEAAGAPKKQTKARNRKLIGPKNAPRAPGSKKKEPGGGTSTPETPGGARGRAGPEPRGGVGEGFCNKEVCGF